MHSLAFAKTHTSTRAWTHTTVMAVEEKPSWECIKVPWKHLEQVIFLHVLAHSSERGFFVPLKCQFQRSLPFQITSVDDLNVELISSKNMQFYIMFSVLQSGNSLGVMMICQFRWSISFLSVFLSSYHLLHKHCHPYWPAPHSLISCSFFSFSLFSFSLFFRFCLADISPLHQTKERAFVLKVKQIASPSGETFTLVCIHWLVPIVFRHFLVTGSDLMFCFMFSNTSYDKCPLKWARCWVNIKESIFPFFFFFCSLIHPINWPSSIFWGCCLISSLRWTSASRTVSQQMAQHHVSKRHRRLLDQTRSVIGDRQKSKTHSSYRVCMQIPAVW